MSRTYLLITAAVALAAGQTHSQSLPNPGGMSPDTPRMETGNPPKDHTNTQDKLFVRQATIGGRAEVELGALAEKKASADAVQAFAQRMQKDHSKGNDQLMRVGKKANPSIPKELDPEHQRIRDELDDLSGREFDLAYMTSQIQDHQKTVNLLLWEISFGQSAELTKYAADTLPVVMEHLQIAKREKAALASAPPPR